MVRIGGKVGAERRSARCGCHSACGSRARGGGGRGGGDYARGSERHFEARSACVCRCYRRRRRHRRRRCARRRRHGHGARELERDARVGAWARALWLELMTTTLMMS